MVRSRTVKLCEHVRLVCPYVPMFFSRLQGKRTICNCRKSEGGISSYNCMVEVRKLLPLMVPLLSVRVTNNTEKTFSMFSRDPSRSLTLSQHCTRHAQWDTNMSMWACFPPPFSIHWYAAFSAMGKLAWAFSLTDAPFAQFPPNKLSILWNYLANSMCFRYVCAS